MSVRDLDVYFLKITHAQISPGTLIMYQEGMSDPNFKTTAFR